MENLEAKYYLKSLGNALRMLSLFESERRGLTIWELVSLSGFDRSSVNRIVKTMLAENYLSKIDNKYYLSSKYISLGNVSLQSYPIFLKIKEEIKKISYKYNETTIICIGDNGISTIIDYCEPPGASFSRSQLGTTLPLNCSAVGKVFLSQENDDTVRHIMEKECFFGCAGKNICSIETLLQEINFVREHGYYCAAGDYMLDTGAVAIPIYSNTGVIVAGVSLMFAASIDNSKKEAIIVDLLNMGNSISQDLGYMQNK